jgi:hypothetical protein
MGCYNEKHTYILISTVLSGGKEGARERKRERERKRGERREKRERDLDTTVLLKQ